MTKKKFDADDARIVLELINSPIFKEYIEDWYVKDQQTLLDRALLDSDPDNDNAKDPLKRLGMAKGVNRALSRIYSLRAISKHLIAKELEELNKIPVIF